MVVRIGNESSVFEDVGGEDGVVVTRLNHQFVTVVRQRHHRHAHQVSVEDDQALGGQEEDEEGEGVEDGADQEPQHMRYEEQCRVATVQC